jgi:transcriptional regulator GlxA family with amidase domain
MFDAVQIKAEKKIEDGDFERRLDYARYLLTQTAEPLGKIAANCGWQSERAFAAVFQIEVGVSPTHYRSWHRH